MRVSYRYVMASIAAGGVLVGCVHAAKPSANAKAAPEPIVEGAEVHGPMSADAEALRKVIWDHAPEIRSCYEQRLASDPTLRGKVVIKWVIQSDGSASDAIAVGESTTLTDRDLHACMVARIATWKFPAPRQKGGVDVITYPWIFRNGGRDAAGPGGR